VFFECVVAALLSPPGCSAGPPVVIVVDVGEITGAAMVTAVPFVVDISSRGQDDQGTSWEEA
jgi:hypothetical protein